jgi:hypothetical protein
MKTKIAFLFWFLFGLSRAQQNNFIIGTDNLNPFRQNVYSNAIIMTPEYWDTIKSFNLNFGTIVYRSDPSNLSNIQTELNTANSKGIQVELNPVTYPNLEHVYGNINETPPQRWMYQIEGGNNDFSTHNIGEDHSESPSDNKEPEEHWSFINDKLNHPNYRLLTGSQTGIVVEGINNSDTISDNSHYWIKVKVKKTGNSTSTNPVIRVTVSYLFHDMIVNKSGTIINSF